MAGDAAPLRDPEKDVVSANPLQITWWAALAGSATAIIAFVIAILDELNALNLPENIQIAVIALIGAGIIGWAISSAGDALARAYASAHVIPGVTATTIEGTETKTPPKPAIQTVADTLAKAYSNAHVTPEVTETTSDGTQKKTPPRPAIQTAADALAKGYGTARGVTAAAAKQQPVPLLPPLTVQVGDTQGQAVMFRVKDDNTVEYLVGLNGQQLDWKPLAQVRMPSQASGPFPL